MKGYKVFKHDWTTTNGFQWKVGETYKHDGKLVLCESGFHFCKNLVDCFQYYKFDSRHKVAEVEALGKIKEDKYKCVTDKIKIVREIPWDEVLTLVNIGHGNSGYYNSGDDNSGRYNTGDCNSGSCNTGNYNTGHHNSGHHNRGERNTGIYNIGDHNTGDYNTGKHNTGDYNTGMRNSGDHNSGLRNTGHYNIGNHNSGNSNAGSYNIGNHNIGNHNSGKYNTGDYNSGSFNTCDHSTGFFNTKPSKIYMFNKPCDLTWKEIIKLPGMHVLRKFRPIKWIPVDNMSDEERAEHLEWMVTKGYLKCNDFKDAFKEFWISLDETDRQVIKDLPNFDANIFQEITGVNTDKTRSLTVVTLCGSHRFYDEFIELKNTLESSGIYHVLTPEIFNFVNPSKLSEDTHKKLDELHQAKMKMSDYVLIVNKGGYIGKDTQAEIDWCNANGIPVKYLEN